MSTKTNRYYVYLTENLVNGKKYIGKRKRSCEISDDQYLGSGKILQFAIAKYGEENFRKSVIEECSSEEECNIREMYWIEFYNATQSDDFYNIAKGGNGGNTYAGLTTEELDRIRQIKSIQCSGENNPHYQADVTVETRKKISDSLRDLYSDPRNCSRFGKFGADNPMSKRIRCRELNKEFDGIREAARIMGIPSPNISRALKDKSRYSAGKINGIKLHWEYCEG